jgi:hypothetical protein
LHPKFRFNYSMSRYIPLITLILTFNLCSQINVGPVGITENVRSGLIKFAEGSLDSLVESETIFVYKSSDIEHLEELKSTLSKVWTINKLKFQSYAEFIADEEQNNAISYFSIDASST